MAADFQVEAQRRRTFAPSTFEASPAPVLADKTDIFIAHAEDSGAVLTQIRHNFEKDIHQTNLSIRVIAELTNYLKLGLDANARLGEAIVEDPVIAESPLKHFIIVEVIAENLGRTDALVKDHAILDFAGKTYHLRGLGDSPTFDVYAGRYFKAKHGEVISMSFSHDPENTTLGDITELGRQLERKVHKARVQLEDTTGRRWWTPRFLFEEAPPG